MSTLAVAAFKCEFTNFHVSYFPMQMPQVGFTVSGSVCVAILLTMDFTVPVDFHNVKTSSSRKMLPHFNEESLIFLCLKRKMHWHGIWLIIYLDDILIIASYEKSLREDFRFVRLFLEYLGFLVRCCNRVKAWGPCNMTE